VYGDGNHSKQQKGSSDYGSPALTGVSQPASYYPSHHAPYTAPKQSEPYVLPRVSEVGSYEQNPSFGKESAEPKKKLIIMRGLPGSGKSTLARKLEGTKGMICSTDDLFYENGRYNFNPSKLGENHAKNKVNAEKAMQRGFSPVIIDNTNLSREEMEPYVALGIKYSYSVELREPDTSWKYDPTQLARRNSHSIQEYKIERMLERFNRDVTAEMMIKQLSKSEDHQVCHTYSTLGYSYKPLSTSSPHRAGLQVQAADVSVAPTQRHASETWRTGTLAPGSTDSTKSYSTRNWLQTTSSGSGRTSTGLGQTVRSIWEECPQTSKPSLLEISNCSQVPAHSQLFPRTPEMPHTTTDTKETAEEDEEESLPAPLSITGSVVSSIVGWGMYNSSPNRGNSASNTVYSHMGLGNWGEKYLQECDELDDSDSNENIVVPSDNLFAGSRSNLKCVGDQNAYENRQNDLPRTRGQPCGGESKMSSAVEDANVGVSKPVAEYHDSKQPSISTFETNRDVLPLLQDCFPGQSDDTLLHCWECSHQNLDACMDLILSLQDSGEEQNSEAKGTSGGTHSPPSSQSVPTPSSSSDADTSPFYNSSLSGLHSLHQTSDARHPIKGDFVLDAQLHNRPTNTGSTERIGRSTHLVEQPNDVPQQQAACMENKQKKGKSRKEFEDKVVSKYGEDEGFILKLTPLLAYKLEDMFGSVRDLIQGDDLAEEDLGILLSEPLARDVHSLWKRTLKARKDEIAVRKQLKRKNPQTKGTTSAGNVKYEKSHPIPEKVVNQPGSPTTSAKRSKRKKNKKKNVNRGVELSIPSRSAWQPSGASPTTPRRSFADTVSSTPVKEVVSQQYAEDLQVDEYTAMLEEWMKDSVSLRQNVNDLRAKYPTASQRTMSAILIDSGLDFDYAEVYLKHDCVDPTPLLAKPQTYSSAQTVASTNPQPYSSQVTSSAIVQKPFRESYHMSGSSKSSYTTDYKSDWKYQEMEEPEYRDYRAEAQQHANLRHEAFQKAAKAWRGKQKDLASYYAQQGREHSVKMEEANRRAAGLIFHKNASRHSGNTIDLHGLHVDEALQVLAEKMRESSGVLEVITGRGIHSHNNIPKLKKAVVNYLYRNNINYCISPHNPGSIEVKVPSSSRKYRK
jgi:NEDD4-binding protein 2